MKNLNGWQLNNYSSVMMFVNEELNKIIEVETYKSPFKIKVFSKSKIDERRSFMVEDEVFKKYSQTSGFISLEEAICYCEGLFTIGEINV